MDTVLIWVGVISFLLFFCGAVVAMFPQEDRNVGLEEFAGRVAEKCGVVWALCVVMFLVRCVP